MINTRRIFLQRGALALVTAGTSPLGGPSFLHQLVFAADPVRAAGKKRILICLFQRGAVDGLSMVVPFGDKDYYAARTDIAIPQPTRKSGGGAVLDLDGFFGFHPAMVALAPLYKAGHLAVVQACGSPGNTRSHFDAQDFMECGVVNNKATRDGWLNRTLLACPEDRAKLSPFRAVAATALLPRSLQGDHEALAIPNLKTFGVGSGATGNTNRRTPPAMAGGDSAATGFEGMYGGAVDSVLHGTGKEAFDAIAALKTANPTRYQPANGAQYPNGAFGRSLLQIAQLIKADLGVEVAFADMGGWDTHANQGNATGQLANRLTEFSNGLAALHRDLGDKMNDVVILTMSEFGRTVRQNGNRGTDHGHATCFMILGGPVRGGKVYGEWPGLAREQLYEGRDLALTTDYRDVFAELAQRHLGARDLTRVFPNFQPAAARYLNLVET